MKADIIEWAQEHFVFDKTSTERKFNIERCGFLRDVMEAAADPEIKVGTCMVSAQSGKTQTGIIIASYAIAQDPGPFLWTMPARDEAIDFSRTRLDDSFEGCRPVADLLPSGRYDKTHLTYRFASAPFILVGVQSGSKVSGKPVRWLFIDEEKDYPPGALQKLYKRVRSKWNSKIWRMSTPSQDGDSIHMGFLAGDQRRYHVTCPKCGQAHPMRFRHLLWDKEKSRDALLLSIRYRCPNDDCTHHWLDQPRDRLSIIDGGTWERHNLDAPRHVASWSWNALLPLWNRWADIVSEFLDAREQQKRNFDNEPLKVFLNETAVEPYREQDVVDKIDPAVGEYSVADFMEGKRIDNEADRFMTVDVQRDRFVCVIRAWSSIGAASKLVYYSPRVETDEQLTELQRRYAVQDRRVFIDARYKPNIAYRLCRLNGWIAVQGSDKRSFVHRGKRKKTVAAKPVQRLYSPIQRVHDEGKAVYLVYLATDPLKDILDRFRRQSDDSPEFLVPHDLPPEYQREMNGEVRKEIINQTTKKLRWTWVEVGQNHAWDCEYYQIAAALIYKVLGGHERGFKFGTEPTGVDSAGNSDDHYPDAQSVRQVPDPAR